MSDATKRLTDAVKELRKRIGFSTYPEPSHKGACGPESLCDGVCQEIAWLSDRDVAIRNLDSALAAFEAERDELEKDKERLDWLNTVDGADWYSHCDYGDATRIAIDAAIAKHKGEKG